MPPNSFYNQRRRCARFAAEWDKAVARSTFVLLPAVPGRPLRLAKRRRVRFSAARRAIFLAALVQSCNTREAAEAAGVHFSTVHRRIARDPDFARASAAALEQGYAHLEILTAREREAAARRLRRFMAEIVPTGRITQDFDQMMRLLARWGRPAPRGRARKALTFSETMDSLERKLAALGARLP